MSSAWEFASFNSFGLKNKFGAYNDKKWRSPRLKCEMILTELKTGGSWSAFFFFCYSFSLQLCVVVFLLASFIRSFVLLIHFFSFSMLLPLVVVCRMLLSSSANGMDFMCICEFAAVYRLYTSFCLVCFAICKRANTFDE